MITFNNTRLPAMSFPSSLNRGGINNPATELQTDNSSSSFGMDTYRMKALNLNLNNTIKQELRDDKYINISENQDYIPQTTFNLDSSILGVENPFHLSSAVIDFANKYKFIYKKAVKQRYNIAAVEENHSLTELMSDNPTKSATDNTPKKLELALTHTPSAPSMFTPNTTVMVSGMSENAPLLNNTRKRNNDYVYADCSIKNLVKESHKMQSNLGVGRFRYADFMYCKDLGKVSNNHLIVLRKFAHPIGDNIFTTTGHKYAGRSNGKNDYSTAGDVGRMVTWFGTEDNKLEDILHYNYKASWKQLNSKIDQKESKEDNSQRGLMGVLINSGSSGYNSMASGGYAGPHNLVSKIGSAMGISQQQSDNKECLYNYDNNKVYTPKNTIQDTHIYEGKLTFSQDFTLTFCYKLRAYDNINPKTAFLDLLGNILEVTYRRGTFWGGEQKIIGPKPNHAAWKKADAFINNTWDKLGGIMKGLGSGDISIGSLLSNVAQSITSAITDAAKAVVDTIKGKSVNDVFKSAISGMVKLNEKTGFSNAIKGQLKNVLGRPAMYAFDSLLSDDNVGLWHVTVGNPFNPIFACGNLIINDDVTVQHSGPLGVDDFPTELKVTVKLKHAKSRDLTDIEKMYTKGSNGFHTPIANHKLSDFFDDAGSFNETKYDDAMAEITKAQAAMDEKAEKEQELIEKYTANAAKYQEAKTNLTKLKNLKVVKNKDGTYSAVEVKTKSGSGKSGSTSKNLAVSMLYGAAGDEANQSILSNITGSTAKEVKEKIEAEIKTNQDTIKQTQTENNKIYIENSDLINRGSVKKVWADDPDDPDNPAREYAKQIQEMQAADLNILDKLEGNDNNVTDLGKDEQSRRIELWNNTQVIRNRELVNETGSN